MTLRFHHWAIAVIGALLLHGGLAYAFFYSPKPTQGGGHIVREVKQDYVTTLRLWLEKHKTYSKKAKRRRQQGVVILAFSITRNGRVPEFHIKKSSGFKSLDQETIKMIKRARPLPKFSKDMDGDILKIALPIQFALW